MRPIGLGHFTFLHLSPVELVETASAAGFQFVGLRFHAVAPGKVCWLPDPAGLRELVDVMQGEGVTLYDIETVVIDEGLDPQVLIPAMDAAAMLGARRVNTCADQFDGLPDTFAFVCELAAQRGLGVDLECMAWRGIDSPAACLDLIEASGAANAAYLVDALHHIRCGGRAEDIARVPRGRILSAQFCDAPAASAQGRDALIAEARGHRLLPGDGGLPLRAIAAALPPDTTVSVELPSTTDPRAPLERARAIRAAMADLFESAET